MFPAYLSDTTRHDTARHNTGGHVDRPVTYPRPRVASLPCPLLLIQVSRPESICVGTKNGKPTVYVHTTASRILHGSLSNEAAQLLE